jgi:hypothetical protein
MAEVSSLRQRMLRSHVVRPVLRAWNLLQADTVFPAAHLPGHYYSPLPNLEEVQRDAAQIYAAPVDGLLGIDLNLVEQIARRDSFRTFYSELPFPEHQSDGWRYYYENQYFSYSDAITLFCFLRAIAPRHVIEVGSGFSSALMLDTNQHFLDRTMKSTFIDPNPERLLGLVTPADRATSRILESRVQDVDPGLFSELDAGDILFVDSSHVSKCGSDVNWILFAVLPRLKPGVFVHFHDVFYPFEYPIDWVRRGFAWNEAYLLRAFLQYNSRFRIAYFNSYLEQQDRDWYERSMPLCLRHGGQSLWLVVQ